MLKYKVFETNNLPNREIGEKIIELDRVNMKEEIEKAGLPPYDDKWRWNTFKEGHINISVFNENDDLVAYLEFGPTMRIEGEFCIYSFQIDKNYRRRNCTFINILVEAKKIFLEKKVKRIICGVFKTNVYAMNLYKKFGFSFEDIPNEDKELLAVGDMSLLNNSVFSKYEARARRK